MGGTVVGGIAVNASLNVMTSGKIGLSIDGGIVVSGALLLALVLFLISRIKYIKN
jgi:hypothetical protein